MTLKYGDKLKDGRPGRDRRHLGAMLGLQRAHYLMVLRRR